MYNGKAHHAVVLSRWLSLKCAAFAQDHPSPYTRLRASVMWGWVEFLHLAGHPVDPDWYCAEELRRLDLSCKLILHGCKVLTTLNFLVGKPRWKGRPKLHQLWHVNDNAQLSHRPIRAFWTWKDEEGMGKLSRIACAVHGARISDRALQRWVIHFFNAID